MDKSPDAFRTISEVAEDIDLPQHVLRFWETRFAQIKPLKRGGGRRYYRPADVELLRGIRHLLYGEGYTIRGVQRILKEEGVRFVQSVGRGEQVVAPPQPNEVNDGADEAEVAWSGADGSARSDDAQAGILIPADERPALGVDALAQLQAALTELQECQRMLSALDAPDDEAFREGRG